MWPYNTFLKILNVFWSDRLHSGGGNIFILLRPKWLRYDIKMPFFCNNVADILALKIMGQDSCYTFVQNHDKVYNFQCEMSAFLPQNTTTECNTLYIYQ